MDPVEEKLLLLVRAHLRRAGPDFLIPMDAPLVELGLDSLRAIDLLFQIEEQFGIVFPDQLLNEVTFKTRHALQQAVQRLLSERDETSVG